jgi:hypothetical protein
MSAIGLLDQIEACQIELCQNESPLTERQTKLIVQIEARKPAFKIQ